LPSVARYKYISKYSYYEVRIMSIVSDYMDWLIEQEEPIEEVVEGCRVDDRVAVSINGGETMVLGTGQVVDNSSWDR